MLLNTRLPAENYEACMNICELEGSALHFLSEGEPDYFPQSSTLSIGDFD